MGSESQASYHDERPIHRVYLERFWMARTPVTNAQYRVFVEMTGCEPPEHWAGGKPRRGLESHPVVNVTWHDAYAYCRWLSEATGKAITLPSEAQWEKAARGDRDSREYPWGDNWDAGYCNCRELGLGDTTPVGVFPAGASPYGILDMVGNVWEWTLSLGGKDANAPTFGYPYSAGDGREDLDARDDVFRVQRGGSYANDARITRCASRGMGSTYVSDNVSGFRVAMAVPSTNGHE
jgi:formylglycine-generating enzyme required for sulfatase activity